MRDYHTHTFRCKHARGDVEDYAKIAVSNRYEVLGISDHTPLPDSRYQASRMEMDDLEGYVEVFHRAQKTYPQLKMLLGLECEYLKDYHGFYKDEILGRYGMDYLILGQHFFRSRGEMFFIYQGPGGKEELKAYADYLVKGMESGLFAFVAHPDVFGVFYELWDEETKACSRYIIEAAQALKIPLEINGYGFRKGERAYKNVTRYQYPLTPFWEMVSHYDVEVVINADAHKPEDVAFQPEAWDLAQRFGLKIADLSHLEGR